MLQFSDSIIMFSESLFEPISFFFFSSPHVTDEEWNRQGVFKRLA